jgi:hypothetical protein
MRRWLISILLVAGTAAAFAGSFRFGAQYGAEFLERPSVSGVIQAFDQKTNLLPGLYWEYAPGNLGFGMTGLFDFNKVDVAAPVYKQLWLDYITSLDLRFHILGPRAFLDPFVEAGFGTAGRSDVTNYEAVGAGSNDFTPTNLSLFGQVGGGLALKLAIFQLGARFDWRFWNGAVPGTSFDPYPLKNFSVALFGGLAF